MGVVRDTALFSMVKMTPTVKDEAPKPQRTLAREEAATKEETAPPDSRTKIRSLRPRIRTPEETHPRAEVEAAADEEKAEEEELRAAAEAAAAATPIPATLSPNTREGRPQGPHSSPSRLTETTASTEPPHPRPPGPRL